MDLPQILCLIDVIVLEERPVTKHLGEHDGQAEVTPDPATEELETARPLGHAPRHLTVTLCHCLHPQLGRRQRKRLSLASQPEVVIRTQTAHNPPSPTQPPLAPAFTDRPGRYARDGKTRRQRSARPDRRHAIRDPAGRIGGAL